MKKIIYSFLFISSIFTVKAEQIPYITFSAKKTTTVYLQVSGLEYSINNSEWKQWQAVSKESAVLFGDSLGDLQLRGKLKNGTNDQSFVFSSSKNNEISCSGDIRTLVDYENYIQTDCSSAIFSSLFYDCTDLVSAPSLPITNIAPSCYESMFENCIALKTAPELPATELAKSCYSYMFAGCTSLEVVPELPATNLANSCYQGMFSNCESIVSAPELPATTLSASCYRYMFYNCSNLTNTQEVLPAAKLQNRCYSYMYYGCNSLEVAPELPALKLVEECYTEMFENCKNLSYIKMMATNISANNCLLWWVHNISSEGTFVKNSNATWNKKGDNGIPNGWTIDYATGITQISTDAEDNDIIYDMNGQIQTNKEKGLFIRNGKKILIK